MLHLQISNHAYQEHMLFVILLIAEVTILSEQSIVHTFRFSTCYMKLVFKGFM